MITITPIIPSNVSLFKAVRLRALQDTPYAFGSTYQQESQLTNSEWLKRVKRMNGQTGIGFLAMDGETGCGIACSFLDQNDPTRAHLVSMWTSPAHRRGGVGRLLVDEVVKWAQRRNARMLLLMVTSVNQPAMRFYERLGFSTTGRTEPYPNDPAVIEYEMSRSIG